MYALENVSISCEISWQLLITSSWSGLISFVWKEVNDSHKYATCLIWHYLITGKQMQITSTNQFLTWPPTIPRQLFP